MLSLTAACSIRAYQFLFLRQLEKLTGWFERAHQPVGAARAIGRVRVCGASHGEPLAVNLARKVDINRNVPVTVCGFGSSHTHGLMPAVLSRDRVRMNGESQVL